MLFLSFHVTHKHARQMSIIAEHHDLEPPARSIYLEWVPSTFVWYFIQQNSSRYLLVILVHQIYQEAISCVDNLVNLGHEGSFSLLS